MKKFTKKFENIMAVIAFAEAGDFKTAREMLTEQRDDLSCLAGKKPGLNMLAESI